MLWVVAEEWEEFFSPFGTEPICSDELCVEYIGTTPLLSHARVPRNHLAEREIGYIRHWCEEFWILRKFIPKTKDNTVFFFPIHISFFFFFLKIELITNLVRYTEINIFQILFLFKKFFFKEFNFLQNGNLL